MTSQQFAWMVKKQKSIQQKVNQQLGRLNRYDEYYEIIIDTLKAITETLEDKALYRLMDAVDVASADKGLDQVKQALAYICENYRVERKVIRNRRQSIMERMARRTLCAIPYTPLSLNENYNEIGVIQNTLAYLAENGENDRDYVTKVAIPLMSSLFSSPWAFEEVLHRLKIGDSILVDSVAAWKQQAESEHKLVDLRSMKIPM